MRFRDVRDGVLLVDFPEASDDEANRAAISLSRSLAAAASAGLRDAIPAARSLLVVFEPRSVGRDRIAEEISRHAATRDTGLDGPRRIRIPVVYGTDAALDLAELARGASLSEEEFARRHAAAEYRVAFVGFAPGFAYLQGLAPELHAPRLASPRPRVFAGTLGIGGSYTGVYPAAIPGGWRLIGRTSIRLFDPDARPPAVLSPGDLVRFDPVRAEALPPPAPSRRPTTRGQAAFRVCASGLFATIQGRPRYGLASSGVPPGGAMDPRSLARANAMLGNDAGAAALEIALSGPELEALESIDVAVAGADFAAELDGKPAPAGGVLRISAGSRLRFRTARRGARAYLAVAGGLIETSRPGEPPARIAPGEDLARASVPPGPRRIRNAHETSRSGDVVLRVIPGPQSDHFAPAAIGRFLSTPWRVSPVSDRRGLRLEGEPLLHLQVPEIPPEGAVPGSIQVPGDGRPIVLGPDGPVTGGYPKIATVIDADLPLLGQAAPGDVLRFRAVTLEEAVEARREYD